MANGRLWSLLLLALSIAAPALADEPLPVPQPTPEALAYHHWQDLFWLADQALDFILPAVILFTGWSAGIRAWTAQVTGGRWYPTLALFSAIYAAGFGRSVTPRARNAPKDWPA